MNNEMPHQAQWPISAFVEKVRDLNTARRIRSAIMNEYAYTYEAGKSMTTNEATGLAQMSYPAHSFSSEFFNSLADVIGFDAGHKVRGRYHDPDIFSDNFLIAPIVKAIIDQGKSVDEVMGELRTSIQQQEAA